MWGQFRLVKPIAFNEPADHMGEPGMAKQEETKTQPATNDQNVSLVPLYSPLDVSKGLQAYRRGDMILYTVRGEPEQVKELISELDGRGVDEVVALVSHHSDQPEDVHTVDAEPADEPEGDDAEGENTDGE
jgi:hypothetical protein